MNQRIFVTGIGLCTTLGNTKQSLLDALQKGTTAYGRISKFDVSTWPVQVGGIAPEASPEALGCFHNKLRGMGNYVKMGIIAAQGALQDAGIAPGDIPPERLGAFVASGWNGNNADGLFRAFDVSKGDDGRLDLEKFGDDGIDKVHPWWLLGTISNNLIFFVTHFLNMKGPNSNACNSMIAGAYMIDRAIESLLNGEIDVAVVGGADCPVNWQMISDLSGLGILAEGPAEKVLPLSPFSEHAYGAILTDSATFLVIETETHALARQRKGLAEICGVSLYGDFADPIHPSPDGTATTHVLRNLLTRVDNGAPIQLNLSASGLQSWDQAEASGLEAFRRQFSRLYAGAAKPLVGNSFSNSFVLETALSILALQEQQGLGFLRPPTLLPRGLNPATFGRLGHFWGINLGQCFSGNTGGILLRVL